MYGAYHIILAQWKVAEGYKFIESMQKKNNIILKKNDLAKNPCVLLFDKGDLGKNIILFFHTDSTKHSFASISTAISQFTWKNGTGIVVMNFFSPMRN